jgi:hypothetical protein
LVKVSIFLFQSDSSSCFLDIAQTRKEVKNKEIANDLEEFNQGHPDFV